jgi:hypothetical protein
VVIHSQHSELGGPRKNQKFKVIILSYRASSRGSWAIRDLFLIFFSAHTHTHIHMCARTHTHTHTHKLNVPSVLGFLTMVRDAEINEIATDYRFRESNCTALHATSSPLRVRFHSHTWEITLL